jgi:hypothetical protein
MTRMIGKVIALTLVLPSVCLPQSTYNKQLQPGLNTRADAVRVLGQPLRALDATQFEYPPPRGAERLVVEYRNGSDVIERIEAYFIKPYSRATMTQSLKLPQQADATRTNSEGKLVEYFAAPALVLTYATAEGASGVMSLGYYSRELFESVAGLPRSDPTAPNRPLTPNPSAPNESASSVSNSIPSQPNARANAQELFVPEGTEFTAVTTEKMSSKTAVEGDRVILKVDEQVVVKGRVVINKGTTVKGSVVNAEKSGRMGKSGKIAIRVESTTTVDGQEIKLRASKGKEGGGAVVSTVALTVLFGPIGLLKKGGEATIKEGTKIKVYTDEERRVLVKD